VLRSRRLSYLLAVATAWLPVYFVAFLVGVLVFVFSIGPDGVIPDSGGVPTQFVIIFVLHLMTILVSLGLLVVYLVDVFRNPDLVDKQDKRILWG
jgi:hypothetical protein